MKLFWGSIAVFTIASFSSSAFGDPDWTNQGPNSVWENPSNWINEEGLGAVPTSINSAHIFPGFTVTNGLIVTPGGNSTINITATSNQSVQSLLVSSDFDGSNVTNGILNLSFNSSSTLTVGIDGLVITGASTVNFTGNLSMSNGEFMVGTGSSTIDEGEVTGSGRLSLNSGSVNLDGGTALILGDGAGVAGTITQNAGSVVTSGEDLVIGAGGTGTYTMTNNSVLNIGTQGAPQSIDYAVVVGATTGSTGFMTIGGSSTVNGVNEDTSFVVGVGGTGVVTQSGTSSVNLDGNLSEFALGVTGGSGTYNLESGTLTLGATSTDYTVAIGADASSTGTLTQSGGTLVMGAGTNVDIGEAGTGVYNLSVGRADFQNGLTLGDAAGSSGTIVQSSGTLTVENAPVVVGNNGTGLYEMKGGSATFNDGVVVGSSGSILQTGGTFILANGSTLDLSAVGSSYTLGGGILQINSNALIGANGEGTFNFGGGTLQLTSAGTLTDNLNGTVTGNSTINTAGDDVNLNGNLTGNGTLNIGGGGTVALSGVNNGGGGNTDSWGAIITGASTLNASSVTSLSSTGSYVIGTGSTFAITNNTAQTFAGNISVTPDQAGPATFITGSGKLTLSGNINLPTSSTTTIGVGGGLEVNTGTISNINGSAGNTVDTFDVGNGSTKGTVYLLGTNTLPQVTVNAGSTLYTANVAGNVTNHGSLGTLGTLNGPTTTTITGSLVSNGTLIIHSNSATADEFGSLTSAMLSGTVKVLGVGSVTDAVIVDTTGGVTATIGTAPGDLSATGNTALFHADLTNNGTQLLLTTTQSAITGFAQTPNEVSVAGSIDHVINAGAPYPKTFLPVLGRLNQLSASAIPQALEELTPESLQYSRDIAFENSTFLVQKMNGVDANLRGGYAGLDTSGISVTSPFFNSGLGQSLGSLLASDSPSFHDTAPNGVNYYPGAAGSPSSESITPSSTPGSPAAESAPEWNSSSQVISDSPNPYLAKQDPSSPQAPGFSEFISGDAILADLNQDHNAPNAPSSSANYTAVSATAGVSFRMTSHLAAGVLMDYSHTDATTDSSGSKTSVDSYSPGLYATYFDHGFYVNGLFSYGINSYSNSRDIGFLGETADSHPHGDQYVGDLDFGYDFHPDKNWVVGPTLGLTYTHLDIDSFSETGAPGADLNVDSQSADSLRSRLGGHVVFQTNTGDVLLQPNLTAMWQHEYLDNSSAITSSFGDFSSTPFVTDTAGPNRDSALIGVGLTATLNTSVALYLNYYADIGFEDYFAQSIVGGLKARF